MGPTDGAIAVVEDAARWKNDRSCARSSSNVHDDDGSDGCDEHHHRKIGNDDDDGVLAIKLSLCDVQRTRRRGEGGGVGDGGRGRKTGA